MNLFVVREVEGVVTTATLLLAAYFSDVYEGCGNLDGALFDQVNMKPWQVNALRSPLPA